MSRLEELVEAYASSKLARGTRPIWLSSLNSWQKEDKNVSWTFARDAYIGLVLMMQRRGALFKGYALPPGEVGTLCAQKCGRVCFVDGLSVHHPDVCPRLRVTSSEMSNHRIFIPGSTADREAHAKRTSCLGATRSVALPIPSVVCAGMCTARRGYTAVHIPGVCSQAHMQISPETVSQLLTLPEMSQMDAMFTTLFSQIWVQSTPSAFSIGNECEIPDLDIQARRSLDLASVIDSSSSSETTTTLTSWCSFGSSVSKHRADVCVVIVPTYNSHRDLWLEIDGVDTSENREPSDVAHSQPEEKCVFLAPDEEHPPALFRAPVQPFSLAELVAWGQPSLFVPSWQVIPSKQTALFLHHAEVHADQPRKQPQNDTMIRFAGLGPPPRESSEKTNTCVLICTSTLGQRGKSYARLSPAIDTFSCATLSTAHIPPDTRTALSKEQDRLALMDVASEDVPDIL